MRSSIALALLASLAACSGSDAVTCKSDADCPSGAACDPQQHVCMIGAAVTEADVKISTPASGDVADGTLSAVATAHAPGGVTSLSFEVRSTAGALFASSPGTAAAADPSSFSATVPLAGAADGSAFVRATITYGAGKTLTSEPVPIQLDQRPPAITLQTDGRTRLLAGGQTATVTAQIGDGAGTGVVDSSVLMRIANHPDVPGTGSGGLYSFSLPIDDSLSTAGTSVTVPFQILAADRLGHTKTLAGDPKAVLRIDRDKPRITGIAVTTPAPFTKPDGTKVFDPGAGFMKVQATISDGAGVDESTVCLRGAGETDPCPHLGTNHGAGNVYDFDLPPPAGSFDGDPVPFTLSADDLFAATLPEGPKAEHQGVSLPQPVLYDNTPPVVTVAADTSVYARTGGPIDVTATITDGTGLGTVQLVSRTAAPVTSVGNVFTFKLNAGDAPLGLEGPFAFQVLARDSLGHSTIVSSSRLIDGAPPAVSVQIFKTGTDPVPTAAGVTYPAVVPNTGWTGGTFIFSDTVHVSGTLTDLSGVASATLHVDGIGLNGEVTAGKNLPLDVQCPQGPTGICSFDTDVTLKDVSGAFHSTDTIPLDVNDSIPAASLQVVIDTRDSAVSFAGVAAPNAATQRTAVQTTRFLWRIALANDPTATTAVSGLAIHPSGDVIVTTSGPAGDLYDLAPDQPLQQWNGSAGVPIGAIPGTPAVGAGDKASAKVYVASAAGVLYAFDANGGLAWSHTAAPFSVGPAIANIGTPPVETIVIPDAVAAPNSTLWTATAAAVNGVKSDERDLIAAPLILGGGVYFATQAKPSNPGPTHVTMHTVAPDGTIATPGTIASDVAGVVNGIDPFFGLVTDGTNVFAATSGKAAGSLFAFDPLLSQVGKASLASALSAEPTFGPDRKLYASDVVKSTSRFDPVTFAKAPFVSLVGSGGGGGTGRVPLHGSNGHTYFPRNSGQALFAYEGTQLSWQFKPGPLATTFRSAIIDCQGRLFAAASNTVYAFVTDDRGLADTPWPTLRRDSRNTGNAGAEKYGMRTATGCIQ